MKKERHPLRSIFWISVACGLLLLIGNCGHITMKTLSESLAGMVMVFLLGLIIWGIVALMQFIIKKVN